MKIADLRNIDRVQIGSNAASSSKSATDKSATISGEPVDVAASGLKVSISVEARELASSGKSFDTARVERLRHATCEGLPCDAHRIAARLVEEG